MGPEYIVRWWDGEKWGENSFTSRSAASQFFDQTERELRTGNVYFKLQLLEVQQSSEVFNAA